MSYERRIYSLRQEVEQLTDKLETLRTKFTEVEAESAAANKLAAALANEVEVMREVVEAARAVDDCATVNQLLAEASNADIGLFDALDAALARLDTVRARMAMVMAKPGEVVTEPNGRQTMTEDGKPWTIDSTVRKAHRRRYNGDPDSWQCYHGEDEGGGEYIARDVEQARIFVTARLNANIVANKD